MRITNRTAPTVFLAILLAASALAFMTDNERYVAVPGFTCVIMMLWLWMTLWDRDNKIPFFDVGVFCALATLVYTVYPLVNYWLDGLQFGLLSDNRLRSYNPTPFEIGFFHLRHMLYLFSFVVVYSAVRGKSPVRTGDINTPKHSTQQVIVILFLLLTVYFVLLQLITGVNYNSNYASEAFAERLAAFKSIPLLLLQISSKLGGILFVFKLGLLYIVVSRCRQRKWLMILLVWAAAEIFQAVYINGARSNLVLFFMAAALLYHRMIKPLTMQFLITSGISLFSFFIFLGLYRTYIDFASLQSNLSQADGGIFSGGNEFQALLGTAYDVLQQKVNGAHLPWYLYINDFITILPPQQILPFEKIRASEWYLRNINMSGTGQGYMWGVISQSIVGFDWIELALRGGVTGYILARFHRWYQKHQSGFLETLLYIFFCLKMYNTFRDTTFSLLANLVWEVIPFYILLCIGVAILPRKTGIQQGHGIAIFSPNTK